MIRNAMAYSAIVLAIAVLGLAAIWNYNEVLERYRAILDAGEWIATVVIVLSALALVTCRWWVAVNQGRKPRACDRPCTPPGSPYPKSGWKCITGLWFETDLCLGAVEELGFGVGSCGCNRREPVSDGQGMTSA